MKINGHIALSERRNGSQFVMQFPNTVDISPPFIVTTDDGTEVYTVTEFTVLISREENMVTGRVTYVYGMYDEREARVDGLSVELDTLKERINELSEQGVDMEAINDILSLIDIQLGLEVEE